MESNFVYLSLQSNVADNVCITSPLTHAAHAAQGLAESKLEGVAEEEPAAAAAKDLTAWPKWGMHMEQNGRAYMEDVACVKTYVDPISSQVTAILGVCYNLPLASNTDDDRTRVAHAAYVVALV